MRRGLGSLDELRVVVKHVDSLERVIVDEGCKGTAGKLPPVQSDMGTRPTLYKCSGTGGLLKDLAQLIGSDFCASLVE